MKRNQRSEFSALLFLVLSFIPGRVLSQDFLFGADLSYVNQMEDCGAVFKKNMVPEDVYSIFASEGCNLVRVRLWVDPSWWQNPLEQPEGVKSRYSDLEDVKETIQRSRARGMKVMLDFHYSDFWADPGKQIVPRKWLDLASSTAVLADTVYNYTEGVLSELDSEGLMPEYIQVGNEVNPGLLMHIPSDTGWDIVGTVSTDWNRHAVLFNSAISAIRDIGETASINPEIIIHFADPEGANWRFNNLISHGVTDFDVMGLSYYYGWHEGSISWLESVLETLVSTYPSYDILIAETGYPWTTRNFSGSGNILDDGDPEYLPVIPEKQLEYMTDYARAVMRAGGIGVVFWEPAWVGTPCRTAWGVGSGQDNVAFFNPYNYNFMDNGGGRWMNARYYTDPSAPKLGFRLDMNGQDVSRGVYIAGKWFDGLTSIRPMADEGGGIYSYYTYQEAGKSFQYYFLNDSSMDALEPVPDECRSGPEGLRSVFVTGSDTVLSFSWGSCSGAGPAQTVKLTFNVSMKGSGVSMSNGIFLVGEITGWDFIRMTYSGDSLFTYTYPEVIPGTSTAYYYISNNSWTNWLDYRETVPAECAYSAEITGDPEWNTDRALVVPDHDTVVGYVWGTCIGLDPAVRIGRIFQEKGTGMFVYPVPAGNRVSVRFSGEGFTGKLKICDLSGRNIRSLQMHRTEAEIQLDISDLQEGIYIIRLEGKNTVISRKLQISR